VKLELVFQKNKLTPTVSGTGDKKCVSVFKKKSLFIVIGVRI
jgi:hypothetical protein